MHIWISKTSKKGNWNKRRCWLSGPQQEQTAKKKTVPPATKWITKIHQRLQCSTPAVQPGKCWRAVHWSPWLSAALLHYININIRDYTANHECSEQDAMRRDIFTTTRSLGPLFNLLCLKDVEDPESTQVTDRWISARLDSWMHMQVAVMLFYSYLHSWKCSRKYVSALAMLFFVRLTPTSKPADVNLLLHWGDNLGLRLTPCKSIISLWRRFRQTQTIRITWSLRYESFILWILPVFLSLYEHCRGDIDLSL